MTLFETIKELYVENLIGDNVVTEKKKEKGIEKHIYFSEMRLLVHVQKIL